MSDGVSIRYQPASGPPRRVRYEERSLDGLVERFEEEWTGCRWRTEGHELVSGVTLELDDAELGLLEGE